MPAAGRVLDDCDGISPLESVTTITQDSQLVPIPGARSSRSVGRRSDFVTCFSNRGFLGHMLDHEPSPSLQTLLQTYLLYFTVIESQLSPENVTFLRVQTEAADPPLPSPGPCHPPEPLWGCPEAQAKHTTPPAAPQALGLHNNHAMCLWNQRRGSGAPPGPHGHRGAIGARNSRISGTQNLTWGTIMLRLVPCAWPAGEDHVH